MKSITHDISVIFNVGLTDSMSNDLSECGIVSSEYNSLSSGPNGIMNSFLHVSLRIRQRRINWMDANFHRQTISNFKT